MTRKKWSKEEDELLIKYYKSYTGDELIYKFFPDRTKRSLETRANILGVSGKYQDTLNRSQEQQARKMSIIMTGKTLSDETKQKISNIKKEHFKIHGGTRTGSKWTNEQRKYFSELKKSQGKWQGVTNPRHIKPLNGSENGRWQGGITEVYNELRSDTKDWQHDSMEFCHYKCVVTNDEFDNVHHTTAFKQIIDDTFKEVGIDIRNAVEDYSKEEFSTIRCKLKYIHELYGFGACLCKQVHKLFHDNYGYIKASPYDFLDFIYRIDSGEFDKWFKDNNLKIDINYDYVIYLEQVLFALKSA